MQGGAGSASKDEPVPLSEEEKRKAFIAGLEKFRDPAFLDSANKIVFDWEGHKRFKAGQKAASDEEDGDGDGDADGNGNGNGDGDSSDFVGAPKGEVDDYGRPLPANRKKPREEGTAFGFSASTSVMPLWMPPAAATTIALPAQSLPTSEPEEEEDDDNVHPMDRVAVLSYGLCLHAH
eukprot:TRINITY_DN3025_c0_g1_i1.p1 TRINITY_DN3025_c0_g1~~TRINITY_DN3025_c0_g1_i1.p1  ORF type:complete len:178 (+),score=41.31 TRINITY_DN3025_c0_g1_i1:21-554(+)